MRRCFHECMGACIYTYQIPTHVILPSWVHEHIQIYMHKEHRYHCMNNSHVLMYGERNVLMYEECTCHHTWRIQMSSYMKSVHVIIYGEYACHHTWRMHMSSYMENTNVIIYEECACPCAWRVCTSSCIQKAHIVCTCMHKKALFVRVQNRPGQNLALVKTYTERMSIKIAHTL